MSMSNSYVTWHGMPRYIVKSGSTPDGAYCNARTLCDLYGVNPHECLIIMSKDDEWKLRGLPDWIPVLTIREDGRYDEFREFG